MRGTVPPKNQRRVFRPPLSPFLLHRSVHSTSARVWCWRCIGYRRVGEPSARGFVGKESIEAWLLVRGGLWGWSTRIRASFTHHTLALCATSHTHAYSLLLLVSLLLRATLPYHQPRWPRARTTRDTTVRIITLDLCCVCVNRIADR